MPSIDISARVIHDAYTKFDHSTLQRGTHLGKNDLWIAASAYVTDSTLLTTDGDFEPLLDLGLKVERVAERELK
jgi:tRNA(fMet)-specific endonuclease VapC